MATIENIIQAINNNDKINRYKELEKIINNNETIKKILDESKTIQKELVHAENLNKPEQLKTLKEKYENKMNELNLQPLLMEYLDLQQEINIFLQETSKTINDALMFNLGDKAEK